MRKNVYSNAKSANLSRSVMAVLVTASIVTSTLPASITYADATVDLTLPTDVAAMIAKTPNQIVTEAYLSGSVSAVEFLEHVKAQMGSLESFTEAVKDIQLEISSLKKNGQYNKDAHNKMQVIEVGVNELVRDVKAAGEANEKKLEAIAIGTGVIIGGTMSAAEFIRPFQKGVVPAGKAIGRSGSYIGGKIATGWEILSAKVGNGLGIVGTFLEETGTKIISGATSLFEATATQYRRLAEFLPGSYVGRLYSATVSNGKEIFGPTASGVKQTGAVISEKTKNAVSSIGQAAGESYENASAAVKANILKGQEAARAAIARYYASRPAVDVYQKSIRSATKLYFGDLQVVGHGSAQSIQGASTTLANNVNAIISPNGKTVYFQVFAVPGQVGNVYSSNRPVVIQLTKYSIGMQRAVEFVASRIKSTGVAMNQVRLSVQGKVVYYWDVTAARLTEAGKATGAKLSDWKQGIVNSQIVAMLKNAGTNTVAGAKAAGAATGKFMVDHSVQAAEGVTGAALGAATGFVSYKLYDYYTLENPYENYEGHVVLE